jgi:hypothetical protein
MVSSACNLEKNQQIFLVLPGLSALCLGIPHDCLHSATFAFCWNTVVVPKYGVHYQFITGQNRWNIKEYGHSSQSYSCNLALFVSLFERQTKPRPQRKNFLRGKMLFICFANITVVLNPPDKRYGSGQNSRLGTFAAFRMLRENLLLFSTGKP